MIVCYIEHSFLKATRYNSFGSSSKHQGEPLNTIEKFHKIFLSMEKSKRIRFLERPLSFMTQAMFDYLLQQIQNDRVRKSTSLRYRLDLNELELLYAENSCFTSAEHIDEMNQLLSSNVEENTKPPDSDEDIQVLDAPAKAHPLCIDLTDTHISSISSFKSQILVDLFERELHTPSRPAVIRTDAADADYFSQVMLDRPPPPVSDADIPSNQLLVQHLPLNESPISAGKKGLFSPNSARKKSFLNRTTRAERKNQIQEMKAHKKIQGTSSNLQQALDSDKTMDRAGPSQLQAFPESCEEKGVFNFLLTVLQSQAQQGKNDIALIDRQMNDLQSKRQSLTDMVIANEQQVARLQSAMNPITDPVSHLSVEQMDQLEKNGLGDMEVFPADSVSHVLVGSKRKRIPIDVGDTAPLGNKGIKRRAMF